MLYAISYGYADVDGFHCFRFQSIQEMVILEESRSTEVTVTSLSVQQSFVQTDETIELQNRLNQNQEVTKSSKVSYFCALLHQ